MRGHSENSCIEIFCPMKESNTILATIKMTYKHTFISVYISSLSKADCRKYPERQGTKAAYKKQKAITCSF